MNYARTQNFTHTLQLGDFLEIRSLSPHDRNRKRIIEGARLIKEYEVGNKLLDELEQATAGSERIMLRGNHDYMVERYIDEHPEVEGFIEVEKGLKLKERGVKYVDSYPHGDLFNIGKLYFDHGHFIGPNSARKHLDRYGVSVMYGHTNQTAIATKSLHGHNKVLSAFNIGCLCDIKVYNRLFMNGIPNDWNQAFATVDVRDNGDFNAYIHNIFDGMFSVNGKTYSYKDKVSAKLRKRK